MTATLRTFHFAGAQLRNGARLPRKGAELLRRRVVLCKSGWHGSVRVVDALLYAPGANLCIRTLRGKLQCGHDKVCASLATQTTDYVDARPLLVEFVQWCAARAKGHAAGVARAARSARAAYAEDAADAADAAAARAAAARAAADAAARASAAAYAAERQAQEEWLRPRALALLGNYD